MDNVHVEAIDLDGTYVKGPVTLLGSASDMNAHVLTATSAIVVGLTNCRDFVLRGVTVRGASGYDAVVLFRNNIVTLRGVLLVSGQAPSQALFASDSSFVYVDATTEPSVFDCNNTAADVCVRVAYRSAFFSYLPLSGGTTHTRSMIVTGGSIAVSVTDGSVASIRHADMDGMRNGGVNAAGSSSSASLASSTITNDPSQTDGEWAISAEYSSFVIATGVTATGRADGIRSFAALAVDAHARFSSSTLDTWVQSGKAEDNGVVYITAPTYINVTNQAVSKVTGGQDQGP